MNDILIHAIGTAVPDHSLLQKDMLELVLGSVPENKRLRLKISGIYRNSAIDKRHTVIGSFKDPGYSPPFIPESRREENGPSTSVRNSLFVREAPRIAEKAVGRLFERLPGLKPQMVTHLITASCTGFSAPGFDLDLVKKFGMPEDLERFHLGFMGCLAAFPALRLARSICTAEKNARVLIVCTELCSLHYRHRFDTDTLLANSLFADGAAAALVSSSRRDGNGHGLLMKSFSSSLLSGTGNDMSWLIGDHGFEMVLSRSVAKAIGRNIKDLLRKASDKAGVSPSSIRHWAIHPGGRAILDGALTALGLGRQSFEASYSTLREYGNMSSPTVLFVLDKIVRPGAEGILYAASFGPGLSADSAILEAF